jgi:hypothetical protein
MHKRKIIEGREGDEIARKDTETLKLMFESDWSKRIARPGRSKIGEDNRGKTVTIPTSEDVMKFATGLKERLARALEDYRPGPSNTTF